MSSYSVTLRRVCETFTRSEVESWFLDYKLSDYLDPEEIKIIRDRGIFDEKSLARQIVDTYYMREIGFESTSLFRHYAKLKMKEIMGTYARLIYSASIKFDPLVNEDYTEDFERSVNTTGNSDTSSTGSGFGIQQDTPQSGVTKSDLLQGKYATTATVDQTDTSGNTTATGTESENFKRHLKGNRGISSNIPYLIDQYRNYIFNIYGEIIEKCNDLFMGIY